MRLYYDRDTRSLLCDGGGLEHMVLTEATMLLFREHAASSTSQKPQMTRATAVKIRDMALDIIDNLRADFLAASIDVAEQGDAQQESGCAAKDPTCYYHALGGGDICKACVAVIDRKTGWPR